MPGINPAIICHKLFIKTNSKPVKQKPKRMNKERSHAISDEVDHLLQTGFIREMFYPDWLSNPLLVRKKNGKWRTYMDFTNIKEACQRTIIPFQRSTN